MLNFKTIINLAIIFLAATVPALAATEGRESPGQLIVWIFLGCCALIITAQTLPLIRNLRKQAKIAKNQAKAAEVPPAQ
ncbi:MAG TPA: hypothetical protein VGJ93_14380 [Desulfuromonadaceae bacterium]|jgi:hypothetical protein